MKSTDGLPKVGDRVRFSDHSPIFIVVEVDEEHHSVSLVPEVELTQAPIHQLAIQTPEAKQ